MPVELFQNDKVTPVGITVQALNLGNVRPTIDAAANTLKRFVPGQEIYEMPHEPDKSYSSLRALPTATQGPDVRADPTIWGVFFVSDTNGPKGLPF